MPKNLIHQSIAGLSFAVAGLSAPQLSLADSITDAFSSGKASLNMRYRLESVDDGNPATEDAKANTLRSRLGYTTGIYHNFKAHADFEVINTSGDFNSGTNGHTDYAKVIDPKGEELNQAWLSYGGINSTDLKLGRQRIIFDNARFVGNVGWRQNEQTFDSFLLTNESLGDMQFKYTFISQVNTITGGSVDTSHNLLNIGIDKTAIGKITAYAYLLDNDDSTNDTDTLGLRLKGSAGSFLYTAEYAQQTDAGDNPADLSASYLFGEAGFKISTTKLLAGYESLGSDNGNAGFQTPLATKHAFNGWADKFLSTPDDGLNDAYLKIVSKFSGFKLVGLYHDFSSDNGSTDYGTEFDLVLIKPFNKTFKGLVKYADYRADSFSTDTQKIWFALEANFKQ